MYLGNRRCCINNVIQGFTGPQGAQGMNGLIGTIGLTGSQGNLGPQGVTGLCYRGVKGAVGYRGPQGGLTGDSGLPGPKGNTGPYNNSSNLHFSFTINPGEVYSNSFKELTSLASTPVSNTIFLTSGNYSIQFQLSENWVDDNSVCYIEFYNTVTTNLYYSYVFNPSNSSYLVLYNNDSNLFGTGNDFINLPNNNFYAIRIYQLNTSGQTIQIGGKVVYFSISFTKVS